jgi:HAE1 family hydrophobic/amphiphilic exporter-1
MGDPDAQVLVIPPPPVPGIGTGGGFKLMIQDRAGPRPAGAGARHQQVLAAANQAPGIAVAFSLFNTATPQIRADVDRTRAEMLGVPSRACTRPWASTWAPPSSTTSTCSGRTWRVTAQADMRHRTAVEDIARLRTRAEGGGMVPLGSIATFHETSGPYRVPRYNLFPAAEVQGAALPGVSTGRRSRRWRRCCGRPCRRASATSGRSWRLQERIAGNTAPVAFGLAVVFVFLVLAAMYESWLLPLAVVLIAPMSVLGGAARACGTPARQQRAGAGRAGGAGGPGRRRTPSSSSNSPARRRRRGLSRWDAAAGGSATRLRPILMTSLAFILGVLPLTDCDGRGRGDAAEPRRRGVLRDAGVTIFGLIFTPVFYVVARALARRKGGAAGSVGCGSAWMRLDGFQWAHCPLAVGSGGQRPSPLHFRTPAPPRTWNVDLTNCVTSAVW